MVDVRRAGPADYQPISEVTLTAYQPYFLGDDDPYPDTLRDSAVRDREAELWVATDDDGRVIGTVTLCPHGSSWREVATDDEFEFRVLAVAPTARGRGAGRALVELVERRAREDGHHGVVLSSLQMMTEAHRLYERFGYVRSPERDWAPIPGVDLVTYVKEL